MSILDPTFGEMFGKDLSQYRGTSLIRDFIVAKLFEANTSVESSSPLTF